MAQTVVQVTLFGLLLALATTLPNKDDWDIYSFHINSTVSGRYATTIITSRVANRMEESKEIEFHVRIPKNAFISKFRMFIDGQEYDGVVKAKEEARQQYTEAVSRGQSAGIVSSVGRTLEEFKTSVNIAAHKKVTFELTYEELLKRKLGKYELQIHARPMQPVKDFKIDVHITEKAGINFLEIKGGLSTNAMANAVTKTIADTQAWVYLYPTEDQQKTCDSCGEQGMNGDLVIVYDVNRDTSFGDLKKSSGYFVHHFAPSNLPRIPKNVVFVIDQSGSMHGKKMEQTRTALIHILNDLAVEDFFGIITFDSNIFHWKRELVQANEKNVANAKSFAQRIQDRGATDINEAVLEGTRMLNAHPREGSASILILLTDGDPTSGVTNLEEIQSNVRKAIAGKFPLYCLGFGFDVNFEFLEKMSLQNNGLARRIYADSDADLQLKGFYEEVATPLLTDVTMIYEGAMNVTQTIFSQYYNGSEIVVAGQISDNNYNTFTPQVVAISRQTRVVFSESNDTVELTGTVPDSNIQRVWAYLTVKQLLEKDGILTKKEKKTEGIELLVVFHFRLNPDLWQYSDYSELSGPEKENAKKEALELSLKYNFVTPLTSMVVTKPPGESADVLHKPKEGQAPPRPSYLSVPHSQGALPGYPRGGGVGAGYSAGGLGAGAGFVSGMGGVSLDIEYDDDAAGYEAGLRFRVHHQPKLLASAPDFHIPIQTPAPAPPIFVLSDPVFFTHRYLLKSESQPLPLCYDVHGHFNLKLLHLPSRDLFVNGEIDRLSPGFSRIGIHTPSAYFEFHNRTVTVKDSMGTESYHQLDETFTRDSVVVVKRPGEIDFTSGDVRLVIIIHERGGRLFLWPVLRQQLMDSTITGILAPNSADYEVVQQTPTTKLKIQNNEVEATRHSTEDYSIASAPVLDCLLVPFDFVFQQPIYEFFVPQI